MTRIAPDASAGELHGLLEHVGNGKPVVFRKTDELLSLIRTSMEQATSNHP